MSSFIASSMAENEFDKVIKSMQGLVDGTSVNEDEEETGISGDDLIAEERKRAIMDRERRERQEKREKEREEARQKIRDKYNIKKKDNPSDSSRNNKAPKTSTENRVNQVNEATPADNQDADHVKRKSGFFNNLKKKLGWQ